MQPHAVYIVTFLLCEIFFSTSSVHSFLMGKDGKERRLGGVARE